MLDPWCWDIWRYFYPLPLDWSCLWKICGHSFWVCINFSTCGHNNHDAQSVLSNSYLNYWQPQIFGFLINLYPGTYTLIGAASFMGGVLRMTLSLTVILIESTNELSLGVPILLSVLVFHQPYIAMLESHDSHVITLTAGGQMGWRSLQQWSIQPSH